MNMAVSVPNGTQWRGAGGKMAADDSGPLVVRNYLKDA
jgi:hypothetical protein